jgi:hypothetical protein
MILMALAVELFVKVPRTPVLTVILAGSKLNEVKGAS